ncbi:hypothetical protein JTE90_016672 [Oedothorax gibbosus]|uniref:Uncharacterized protein n=1 Tax=Oedothorax gibbosus TaxID=931172 RepID=A0AAV6V3F8_9ARAC|nr:hypothetical protein JTE90_016672 [Oedothorax gibbosus]
MTTTNLTRTNSNNSRITCATPDGKCNRSISIPAPVQYADLDCYRAKKFVDFHQQKECECGSFSSTSSSY